ncbi:phosphotransferase [Alicyclobacillus cycloheptanicus]|uniref:Ser/Thr protein kinase RdoA (MazF antagonist) n=1 Tax=Alicyclobacillus cycloheptanicus TaxID=1457 RepID=A0ABT9XG01_9BACL|nr:phosphotransferase [Alicyclobacillus cycloheptanicus]MDQ0189223.1 Ser/Thr protein kinase RdoA (MazF antagonist) [Alicyclobacillus cycloheptanicus]WDM00407.1 phosphotransferase [Alicyclobacillus cycloheptanicus]
MRPHLQETPQQLVPDWIVLAAKRYGWQVLDVEAQDSFYRKQTAYRLTIDAPRPQSVVLKPFLGSADRLRRTAQAAEALWQSGYRQMPRWLRTTDNEPYVTANCRLLYAAEWIKGRSMTGSAADLRAVGEMLGKLHRLPIAYDPVGQPAAPDRSTSQWMQRLLSQARRFQRRRPELAAECSDRGRWFATHGAACEDLAQAAWQALSDRDVQEALQRELQDLHYIHGDVTTPNIVIAEEGTNQGPFLIDWDRLCIGSTYMELAKAMANVTNLEAASVLHLLDGYESVRPLHPVERRMVSALFQLPREAWITAAQAPGDDPLLFETLARTWQNRLEAVAAVRQWAAAERQGTI